MPPGPAAWQSDPEPTPDALVVARVLADQERRQIGIDQRSTAIAPTPAVVHQPTPASSGIGLDRHQHEFAMRHGDPARDQPLAQRQAEGRGLTRMIFIG